MKLEDEIQQSAFKSPQQKLAINLLYTTHWLHNHYDSFFKGKDISTQQYNVLRILRGQHPNYCNLKLIKERMLDRMSDASRIIDKLLLKGFVERKSCPDDRRSVNILITDKGLELLKSLDFIDEAIKGIFSSLSTEEAEMLNSLLDKLRTSEK
ncbi:MAG: MarR family transcriptional regulator [Bacteroidetes bacterium]|nr:MarR family transcriptional regulator [Bacteroidota bacterium]